ncbi:Hexokinase [Penicillium subrubescens]|nr:Hexokinase [Penicillium subrubescens]KAJ5895989.1 Hexokinase [Penicillium subrubescens]
MLRLVLITLFEEGKLFKGQDISRLRREHAVDATFLSIAELDSSEVLRDLREEFEENFSLSPNLEEHKICRYLISLIIMRAARLYACGIAASGFKSRASKALRETFDWLPGELDLISLNPSEDGSGVGAALAAALALGTEYKG